MRVMYSLSADRRTMDGLELHVVDLRPADVPQP